MRRFILIATLFFAFFIYGLYLTQFHFSVLTDELQAKNPVGFYDYRGQIDVHTTIGQGSGSPNEVIQAAQETNNDFILINDINDFTLNYSSEGYHHQTLTLVGGQYNYVDSHLIFFDVLHKSPIDSFGKAQVVLADQLSQKLTDKSKDILILAHPFKQGYSWTGAIPSGLDGFELLNLKVIWQKAWQKSKISFLWSLITYPFNSQLALLRLYEDPHEEMELWDSTLRTRKFTAFAGSDATAKTGSIGTFSVKFPSYQLSFGLLSNHVLLTSELTGNFDGDRKKIIDALKRAQFYMSFDILANPKGFNCFIEENERIYGLGSDIHFTPHLVLFTHLPQKPRVDFEVIVIKDGVSIKTFNTQDSKFEISSKGVYKVAVRVIPTFPLPDGKRWLTWIYTNPFYVN
jgi:hypothetical protein